MPVSCTGVHIKGICTGKFVVAVFRLTLCLVMFVLFCVFDGAAVRGAGLARQGGVLRVRGDCARSLRSCVGCASGTERSFGRSIRIVDQLTSRKGLSTLGSCVTRCRGSLAMATPIQVYGDSTLGTLFGRCHRRTVRGSISVG